MKLTFAQAELAAIFDVVISLLRNDNFTYVLEYRQPHVYALYKATQEQAAISKHGALLKLGTERELTMYLQGVRDYCIEFKESVFVS